MDMKLQENVKKRQHSVLPDTYSGKPFPAVYLEKSRSGGDRLDRLHVFKKKPIEGSF